MQIDLLSSNCAASIIQESVYWLGIVTAVREATVAWRCWMLDHTICSEELRDDRKPPKYKHVKVHIAFQTALLPLNSFLCRQHC